MAALAVPMDAAVEETSPAISDPGVDVDTSAVGAEDTTPEGGTTEDPSASEPGTPTGSGPIVDGRLSPEYQKILQQVKESDPLNGARTAKDIKRALFESHGLREVFPGGLSEAKQLQSKLEEWGGDEAITKLRTSAEEYGALSDWYMNGKPELIEDMVSSSPEAFVKMVPQAFAKYAELYPEGYMRTVAQVFSNDLAASGIGNLIQLGEWAFADNNTDRARQIFGQLAQYLGKFDRILKDAPKGFNAPAKPEVDAERQALQQQQEEFQKEQWRTEFNRDIETAFNSELDTLTKGRQLTDQKKAAILTLATHNLERKWKSIGFQEKTARYFSAKDKNGYVRTYKAAIKEHLRTAVQSAVNEVLPSRPGPKPAAAATPPQSGVAKPTAPAAIKAPEGWATVAKRPEEHLINYRITNMDMILEGKAVLKDGRKVSWKR